MRSDATWLCSAEAPAGWEKPGFEPKGWKPAVSLGKLGIGPWGNVLDGGGVSAAPALQALPDFKVEVLYTVIESLTLDGRDRSLDYRITGFHVPRGSWDAQVLDAVAPAGDEIVLPKTSSNVFMSTNIDYLLRNLARRQLIVAGLVTDQCISSAIRDACDLGYLVTMPTDACASYSPERHAAAVASLSGYCRQVTTAALAAELGG